MILQVIFDDQFGDYVIEQFHDYPEQTRIVLVTYTIKEMQYVHTICPQDIVVYGSQEYKDLITHLSDYKAVVMHGLFTYSQYDIIRHLPNETKLAWVLWGAEIYTRQEVYSNYLAPYTRLVYRLKLWKDKISRRRNEADKVPMNILKRVDYMLCSSEEIFEDVKAYIGNPNMNHLQYSYFSVERLIGEDLMDKTVNGTNILLGNSATPDNNHIDVLLRLKRIGLLPDMKLITPLSYCDLWIKNLINRLGHLLFRSHFYPLLEYMPRNEYNKLVQSCSVFIANHHRPNAFGNTLTALWLGARVYISNDSIQTKFVQRLGLHVNIIEKDLHRKNPNLYNPLSETEREENRSIIRARYGTHQMQINLKRILDTLNA